MTCGRARCRGPRVAGVPDRLRQPRGVADPRRRARRGTSATPGTRWKCTPARVLITPRRTSFPPRATGPPHRRAGEGDTTGHVLAGRAGGGEPRMARLVGAAQSRHYSAPPDPVWWRAVADPPPAGGEAAPLLAEATLRVDGRAVHRFVARVLSATTDSPAGGLRVIAEKVEMPDGDRRGRGVARPLPPRRPRGARRVGGRGAPGGGAAPRDAPPPGVCPRVGEAGPRRLESMATVPCAGRGPLWRKSAAWRGAGAFGAGCAGATGAPVGSAARSAAPKSTRNSAHSCRGRAGPRANSTSASHAAPTSRPITVLQPTPAYEVPIADLETVDLDLAALEQGFSRPVEPGYQLQVRVVPRHRVGRVFDLFRARP